MPDQPVYTVEVPGAADIFRIPLPATDDEELRRQRIARMRSHKGALPESLSWIPPLITYLDDAQDLLYVGLVLAKPLLKRLPARFVPGLGWVLLANDALNLTTLLLGLTTGGTTLKRSHLDVFDILNSSRVRGLKRVKEFLARTNWLGFALQAGQVSETLTGYGLSLGAIMGMISDTVWGTIRLAQGADFTIRLPPPEDPLGKAARLITQAWPDKLFPDLFSSEDHALLISARSLAMKFITSEGDINKAEERADLIRDMNVPVFAPTNTASLNALRAEGIEVAAGITNPFSPDRPTVSFLELTQSLGSAERRYQEYLKTQYSNPQAAPKILQMIHDEAGFDFWDFQGQAPKSTGYIMEPWEIAYSKAVEYGVFPLDGAPARGIYMWLVATWKRMYAMRYAGHWGWWLVEYMRYTIPQWRGTYPHIPENLPEPSPRVRRKGKLPAGDYYNCLWAYNDPFFSWSPDWEGIDHCRKSVAEGTAYLVKAPWEK